MNENTTNLNAEQNAETTVSNLEPIPDDFAEIPEHIAREMMKEASESQPEETEQEEPTEQAEQEEAEEDTDEPDGDTDAEIESGNGDEDDNLPKQSIPYARFKQKVDEAKALKAEIAELKKLMAERQQQPQPVYQPPQPQPQQTPQPSFTFEQAQSIKNRIVELAKEMTGMTAEEIEAVSYADDNNADKMRWNMALDLARTSVVADIRKNAAEAVQQRELLLRQQQQAYGDYAAYENRQKAEPDFAAVSNYAQNEYYLALGQNEQAAIAEAYNRICRNVASPQDMFLITRYFDMAKADYRAKQAQKQPQTKPAPAKKKQPPTKFDQIGGTVSAADKTPSLAQIEKMLQDKPFEQLPKEVQELLLGGKVD